VPFTFVQAPCSIRSRSSPPPSTSEIFGLKIAAVRPAAGRFQRPSTWLQGLRLPGVALRPHIGELAQGQASRAPLTSDD
jgi:hypothetical protein